MFFSICVIYCNYIQGGNDEESKDQQYLQLRWGRGRN